MSLGRQLGDGRTLQEVVWDVFTSCFNTYFHLFLYYISFPKFHTQKLQKHQKNTPKIENMMFGYVDLNFVCQWQMN